MRLFHGIRFFFRMYLTPGTEQNICLAICRNGMRLMPISTIAVLSSNVSKRFDRLKGVLHIGLFRFIPHY